VKYWLILQWTSDSSPADYSKLIEAEELLREKLREPDVIDGHDIGSGEMNIFILTDNPQSCFGHVKRIFGGRKIWAALRAAYREADGNEYTILWPEGLTHFEVG